MRHSLIASLIVACFVPALSAPALAAHHGYGYGHGYRQIAHHAAHRAVRRFAYRAERHGAMSLRAGNFGQEFYDYAPANGGWPGGRGAWQPNAWQSKDWQSTNWQSNNRRQSEWAQRDWDRSSNWSRRQRGWGGTKFAARNFGEPDGFNQQYGALDGMAAAQASANGVPVSLVERVIKRESGGNPRAVSRGNYGLMQIRLGTARAMGFTGSAAELLDPQVNMTYAVRYLAGAYRAAGGNESRAVALYASGYYYRAKAQGFSPYAPQPQPWPGFAPNQPGRFQNAEAYGYGRPLHAYRLHHHRHRAV